MSYRFRRKERLGTGLRRILREQIDQAGAAIEAAPQGPGTAVHEVRKGIKRIRAGLRMARSRLEPSAFDSENRRYRRAARALAGAREADVALETLERVAARLGGSLDEALLERTRTRLRGPVPESPEVLAATEGPLGRAGALLDEARRRLPDLPLAHLDPRDLAQGLAWSYRSGREHRDQAYRKGDPAAFHAWRRRSKDLWHQLELVRSAWPVVLRARIAEHRRLADHLGLGNDAVDLDARLAEDPSLVPDSEARDALRAGCRVLRDEAWDAARPLGVRLYAESPRAFEALMRVYLEDTFRKS